MTLTEMKRVLAGRDIRLSKSLGQNFLHDANQLRRILAAAELNPADRVLEIGPGLGPLTELLVQEAGEVLAIEKDVKLLELLQERLNMWQPARQSGRYEDRSVLHLVHDDALEYLRREAHDWSDWKLVANLPYSVASPILVELAGARASSQVPFHIAGRGPKRMVVTLQLEVAKRLLAGPGASDYGILTLLMRLEYEPQGWFKVPATCFFPEPDVDSACICMVRRERPLLPPAQQGAYAAIVKRSFSQRRKMMLKLLKQDWPEPRLVAEFERLGLPPCIRAEEVSLEQFAQLTHCLSGCSL
jgi:16S rRNA (adenine1518-N6/adenine1519-N6)-dimethyltransferase